jgi:hypothetical protein
MPHIPTDQEIMKRIYTLLAEMGIPHTQWSAYLADTWGVSSHQARNITRGRTPLHIKYLRPLALAGGKDLSWFFEA